MRVVVLAGGTGGAKLAAGFAAALAPEDLTVVTNTGDDVEVWGLRVSPDFDAVLYRLAGLFDEGRGWGVREETFAALEMMRALGEAAWFQLGDRDLALHVLRTRLEHTGLRPAEAGLELARRLGVTVPILPAADAPVRVTLHTSAGPLSVQEYLVLHRCEPAVAAIDVEPARGPAPEAAAAVAAADLVVIGPSNPLISIRPILAVLGDRLPRERTVAVTPIVAGESLKGPTVKMLREIGREPVPETVAEEYRGVAAGFVLDERDAGRAGAIRAMDYVVQVADTVMAGAAGAERLAREILRAAEVTA